MKNVSIWCVVTIACLAVGGCGTLRSERAFDRVSSGMTQWETAKRLGNPAITRGSLCNDRGERITVWEYKVGSPKDFAQVMSELSLTALSLGAAGPVLLQSAETDRYWLYFVNGRLAGWGPAGDWEMDREKVRTMRFDRDLER